METKNYTPAETSAAIRRELRKRYPDTKFSVRLQTGTAYGRVTVTWEGGPEDLEVRRQLSKFVWFETDQWGCLVRKPLTTSVVDGVEVAHKYSCDGVSVNHKTPVA